jgi:hypothetical protein
MSEPGYEGKRVIRLVQKVTVRGPGGEERVRAKIDTGADRTTVDRRLAERLKLGPVLTQVTIKASAEGRTVRRPVVNAAVTLGGKEFDLKVGVADRSQMKFLVIVGRDILRSGAFLIDPSRKQKTS